MGRLGDADWWWVYGLDGVVGGLVTGLVTGGAVWLTLRHERRLSEVQAARAVAGRINALAWSAQRELAGVTAWPDSPLVRELVASLFELSALTYRRWPQFSTMLDGLSGQIGGEIKALSPSDLAGRIATTAILWISDPRNFESSWRRVLVRRFRRMRATVRDSLGRG